MLWARRVLSDDDIVISHGRHSFCNWSLGFFCYVQYTAKGGKGQEICLFVVDKYGWRAKWSTEMTKRLTIARAWYIFVKNQNMREKFRVVRDVYGVGGKLWRDILSAR